MGPDPGSYTTPWLFKRLGVNSVVSHGASLRADGIGFFGNWQETLLYKFDTATGNILGSFPAQTWVTSVPVIAPNNQVVIATDMNGGTGKVIAVDTAIMDFNWTFTVGRTSSSDYEHGGPNIGPEGDVVFASTQAIARRVNSITGLTVWQHTLPQGSVHTPVFSRDDSMVFFTNGTCITALDWATGNQVWNVNLGVILGAPGVAPSGTLCFGTDSAVMYGLNPNTGATLWTRASLDIIKNAPAFSQNGTVAYFTSYDTRLYAIRVSDGVRLWSFVGTTSIGAPPSVGFDDRIYFCDRLGKLFCVSPAGTLVWSIQLNGDSRGPLTIGPDGTLYVPTWSGPPSGLTIIKQQATALDPDQVTTEQGLFVSGGLPEILQGDNSYYISRFTFAKAPLAAAVRQTVRFQSLWAGINSFRIVLEAGCDYAILNQRIEMYNYTTNVWEALDTRPGTLADQTTIVDVASNGSRFVQPGTRIMRVRVSWLPNSPGFHKNWSGRLDRVSMVNVVPAFSLN